MVSSVETTQPHEYVMRILLGRIQQQPLLTIGVKNPDIPAIYIRNVGRVLSPRFNSSANDLLDMVRRYFVDNESTKTIGHDYHLEQRSVLKIFERLGLNDRAAHHHYCANCNMPFYAHVQARFCSAKCRDHFNDVRRYARGLSRKVEKELAPTMNKYIVVRVEHYTRTDFPMLASTLLFDSLESAQREADKNAEVYAYPGFRWEVYQLTDPVATITTAGTTDSNEGEHQ